VKTATLPRRGRALAGVIALATSLPLTVIVVAACSHATPAPAAAAPGPSQSDAAASFEVVRAVLQSPRCVNCHPVGDAPLQDDNSHPHLQFVRRGPEGRGAVGLACATCHGKANPPPSYGTNQPPGVSTEWRLPPPEHKMVFEGVSSQALCEQLKDTRRNGGKDMAALLHHVADDPLVLWGWSPGFGRKPVPVAHAEFVRAFKTWADAGAPCVLPRTASAR
jgi:hypothetical protein